ncbi:hypothetical protein ACJJTC_010733 [Scirpophaga incertulas]
MHIFVLVDDGGRWYRRFEEKRLFCEINTTANRVETRVICEVAIINIFPPVSESRHSSPNNNATRVTGRFITPVLVLISTTLTRPSLPGYTFSIIPLGQKFLGAVGSTTNTRSPFFSCKPSRCHF